MLAKNSAGNYVSLLHEDPATSLGHKEAASASDDGIAETLEHVRLPPNRGSIPRSEPRSYPGTPKTASSNPLDVSAQRVAELKLWHEDAATTTNDGRQDWRHYQFQYHSFTKASKSLSGGEVHVAPRYPYGVALHRSTSAGVLDLPRQPHLPEPGRITRRNNPTMNMYSCPLATEYSCWSTFSTQGHATRHSRTHTGSQRVTCPECHRLFSRKDNMENHRRSQHRQLMLKPYASI
ncbi:hypothetical protein MRB53_038663 [Persea americana]|nr:hypothetical protein MRB53_038663 [Persea americana]